MIILFLLFRIKEDLWHYQKFWEDIYLYRAVAGVNVENRCSYEWKILRAKRYWCII